MFGEKLGKIIYNLLVKAGYKFDNVSVDSHNSGSIVDSFKNINITIPSLGQDDLNKICNDIDSCVTNATSGLPDQVANKVVDAVVTKFEEDIIPKFVKEVVDETGNKITEMQTTITEWHDNSTTKINNILDEVATIVAGQEAHGKDLKELLENQEKQDEINRRLDRKNKTGKILTPSKKELKDLRERTKL